MRSINVTPLRPSLLLRKLDVQWLNADSVHANQTLVLRLRVTDGGVATPNARITIRFARADGAPFYTQVVTDATGDVEMKIDAEEASLPDSSILVQANVAGRTATRKFQLKKVEA